MKNKKQWSFSDYAVVIVIIILVFSNCYSCSRSMQKAQKEEIENAYTEGYENGYYDGEHGNTYDPDR